MKLKLHKWRLRLLIYPQLVQQQVHQDVQHHALGYVSPGVVQVVAVVLAVQDVAVAALMVVLAVALVAAVVQAHALEDVKGVVQDVKIIVRVFVKIHVLKVAAMDALAVAVVVRADAQVVVQDVQTVVVDVLAAIHVQAQVVQHHVGQRVRAPAPIVGPTKEREDILMKNELIITSEFINAIVTKTIDEFKQTVQDNLSTMRALDEQFDCLYIVSKVLNNAVFAGQNIDKIKECIQYMITTLGYIDDVNELVTKKCAMKEKENCASIEKQRNDLIDICEINVNDILLGNEIERLLNFLINDYEHVLENVPLIENYSKRLKAIQR